MLSIIIDRKFNRIKFKLLIFYRRNQRPEGHILFSRLNQDLNSVSPDLYPVFSSLTQATFCGVGIMGTLLVQMLKPLVSKWNEKLGQKLIV